MSFRSILKSCHSWERFTAALADLPAKAKGDHFEALVRCYLKLDPTYATKLNRVWLLRDVPPQVRNLLNLPGPDEGIDLIARTKEGAYWAIQCKYRQDESQSLTRRELSTFTDLAFTICTGIDHALVCTNTDRRSRKLDLYGERLSFCSGEEWLKLDETFFQRLRKLLRGRTPTLKPLKPRPHQARAVESARQYFLDESKERGKLIHPCGTGKSLTGYWIAEALEAKTVLVAVPSLALIKQTLEVWARESLANGQEVDWICVCSDESVARSEREDAAVLTQDLGVRVHTDPEEIAAWLRKRSKQRRVVFTTYQSGKTTADAARQARRVFDLGILDEAHKTVGQRDNLFGHLLHEDNIRIRKRLAMTATERHYRGGSDQIASMDDPCLYGDTFELLSFSRALEANPPILSDYKIVTIAVSRHEIAQLIRSNVFVRPDKGRWNADLEAEMLASAVALRKAMAKHPIQHAVSFHSSIARARAFQETQEVLSETFPELGELDTFHVSGRTPTSVRSRELDEFAQTERGLVTNARCLTEGVDVPDIDCVLFADPKRSTIDIVQAVGRALRVSEGKDLGYVVVPILLDEEISDESPIPKSAYESVLLVLRALAANDERIIEYFRSVSQGKRPRGRHHLVEMEVPLGLEIEAEAFIESLELRFWSRLAKLSWRPFEEAREFARGLHLSSFAEWQAYCRRELARTPVRPLDIPTNPGRTYAEAGWISWGDWLGTGEIAPYLKEFLPFEEARTLVRGLGLKTVEEWRLFCRGDLKSKEGRPNDIPSNPNLAYRDSGWIDWTDWLGTSHRPFEEARDFAISLGLQTGREWKLYAAGKLPELGHLPRNIPKTPQGVYRNQGWVSWPDFLGVERRSSGAGRCFRPFTEAREFARNLQLQNQSEWQAFCTGRLDHEEQLPDDIPAHPDRLYRNKGWRGFGDWLGTGVVGTTRRIYRSYEQARAFVRRLRLRSNAEWRLYLKGQMADKHPLPPDIPRKPAHVYRDKGWISWPDWLGTDRS